jgi:hypothetical protein
MPGKVLPGGPHRCFMFYPPEAGMFAAIGTRWQCSGCHTIWKLVATGQPDKPARWTRETSE